MIFDRGIAIFTLGIVVFDLDIAIFGLGIAQLNSHSILLTELSRFEIAPPIDRPRLLRSALLYMHLLLFAVFFLLYRGLLVENDRNI